MDNVHPESSGQQPKLNRRAFARRGLLTAGLIGCGYLSHRSSTSQSIGLRKFIQPTSQANSSVATIHSRMIEHPRPLGFVHCASICQSRSGQTICTWYGGRREGSRDVQVWLSTLNQSSDVGPAWSEPQAVVGPQKASIDTNQFVRKVGNAVSFFDSRDRLWMIYVSIAMGGWATSSLNATYSDDMGTTWSQSQRLWLSPLVNISQLVRCPPVFMSTGEIGLPIYNECAGIFPEMLWLDVDSRELKYRKTRICGGRDWLQPSIVPTGEQTAICYLRCLNDARKVGFTTTQDAGESWSQPHSLDLPNPNSAVCGVLTNDSGVLMALNLSTDNRDSISLVHSADGIQNWRNVAMLDQEPGEKFSYPSMIRGQDGLIHLVYSWKMQKIRHLCFNDVWVMQQLDLKTKPNHSVSQLEQAVS